MQNLSRRLYLYELWGKQHKTEQKPEAGAAAYEQEETLSSTRLKVWFLDFFNQLLDKRRSVTIELSLRKNNARKKILQCEIKQVKR